jgi:hypothetical protein
MSSLTVTQDGLAVSTPYDAAFVAALKAAVPGQARQWKKPHWIVEANYGTTVAQLIKQHFGETVSVPQRSGAVPIPSIQAVRLDYLGRCKLREDGTTTAYGHSGGAWSLIFPESVLRVWFQAEVKPNEPQTLFSVLGIGQEADNSVIKSAYRRLAKQWHPDVSREPDAAEHFLQIQTAYEILSDDKTRKKYRAGLKLEASLGKQNKHDLQAMLDGYRAPLLCGLLLVEARQSLGRFIVSKILDWSDITDSSGRTMVVSWPVGAERYEVIWI